METDYRKMMGVEMLSAVSGRGHGVRIAVLDSGTPPPIIENAARASSDPYVLDEFGHATAVASILFGGNGIVGLCDRADARYIPVLDASGQGNVKSVANGIYKAIEWGADLINLSLGFARTKKCPKTLKKACEAAFDAKIPVICAAGNDGGAVNWPAALETTICVGSADVNGLKMSFSSTGEVDFVAPGANLPVLNLFGGVKTVGGTSFSAAIVTGISALLAHGGRKEKSPKFSPKSLIMGLMSLAKDVDAPGWDEMTGYGMISGENADSAVCMSMKSGFFDRMLSKIKSLIGIRDEGAVNGRV